MCKYTWRKAETSKKLYLGFWKFRKGRTVVSVEEFSSHTAVLAMQTCMCVRGTDHVNAASSSIPSSPTPVFCLFGFLTPLPTSLSFWSSCHRLVHTLGASMFPSASSSSTFSSVTSCFSTSPVNFNLWTSGECIALCFFLTLLLLPYFKILGQISPLRALRNRFWAIKPPWGASSLRFLSSPLDVINALFCDNFGSSENLHSLN